jgi:hypothetical protein
MSSRRGSVSGKLNHQLSAFPEHDLSLEELDSVDGGLNEFGPGHSTMVLVGQAHTYGPTLPGAGGIGGTTLPGLVPHGDGILHDLVGHGLVGGGTIAHPPGTVGTPAGTIGANGLPYGTPGSGVLGSTPATAIGPGGTIIGGVPGLNGHPGGIGGPLGAIGPNGTIIGGNGLPGGMIPGGGYPGGYLPAGAGPGGVYPGGMIPGGGYPGGPGGYPGGMLGGAVPGSYPGGFVPAGSVPGSGLVPGGLVPGGSLGGFPPGALTPGGALALGPGGVPGGFGALGSPPGGGVLVTHSFELSSTGDPHENINIDGHATQQIDTAAGIHNFEVLNNTVGGPTFVSTQTTDPTHVHESFNREVDFAAGTWQMQAVGGLGGQVGAMIHDSRGTYQLAAGMSLRETDGSIISNFGDHLVVQQALKDGGTATHEISLNGRDMLDLKTHGNGNAGLSGWALDRFAEQNGVAQVGVGAPVATNLPMPAPFYGAGGIIPR